MTLTDRLRDGPLLLANGTIFVTLADAVDRIEALEAALRFYARENSWRSSGVYACGHSQASSAKLDRGAKARAALGEV